MPSSALRRAFLGRRRGDRAQRDTKGDCRDGDLKMGWAKPLPRAWPMGIDCGLDLDPKAVFSIMRYP